MLQKLRPKLTFANVMVVVLAFIVLGGGAYAATSLPRNSVGTKQLKRGAVTKAKIKKSTLRELKGAQGPAGATTGVASVAPGGTVPSGATLRGSGVAFVSNPTLPGEVLTANGISFGGFQTPARPVAHIVPVGGPSTAECPGSVAQPEAASGHLCFYVDFVSPAKVSIGVSDAGAFSPGSGAVYSFVTKKTQVIGDGTVARFGFVLSASGSESAHARVYGTWAVTG